MAPCVTSLFRVGERSLASAAHRRADYPELTVILSLPRPEPTVNPSCPLNAMLIRPEQIADLSQIRAVHCAGFPTDAERGWLICFVMLVACLYPW